jgi:serine protease AprX
MKNILILLILFAITYTLNAKDKYLIYFNQKPINSVTNLKKSASEYDEVLNSLSDRSIERRKKNLGEQVILEGDLPINKNYIEKLEAIGAEIVHELKWFNAVSCYLDENEFEQIKQLDFIKKINAVKTLTYRKVEESFSHDKSFQKTESSLLNYGNSLGQMELSDVPVLHDHNINGEGVIVGLLDSGFKTDENNAFANMTILATKDYVFGDDDVGNDNDANHGTGVLSITGGFEEGRLIGPAFNSHFLLAKTENIFEEVNLEEDNFAAAVEWMEAQGVDIISSSLGYSDFDTGQRSYTYADMDGQTTLVTRAYEAAFDRGVVTITSAGNEGNRSWKFITAPGDGANTITVGSVNSNNELAASSSRGPTSDGRLKPEVLAQGVGVFLARPGQNSYVNSNGTSFSAPIVAGITAQLLSVHPHLTNKQIRQIIIESGDNADQPNNDRGYGLLSAKRAVEYPNIKTEGSNKILNKIFLPLENVSTDQVFLHYKKTSEENPTSVNMIYDDRITFTADFPNLTQSDTLELWFTYVDNNGSTVRFPGNVSQSYFYTEASNQIVLSVNNTPPVIVPDDFKVAQNYPNPFNPSTRIEFEMVSKANVTITVYDMLGREIKVLLNEERAPGIYNDVVWNATNNHGRLVSSGAYFYVFKAGSFLEAKKMVFLR